MKARALLVLLAAASATCRPPHSQSVAPQPRPQPGRALSAPEVEAVLRRMKPLATEDEDAKDFALRERSLPPPRPGATVTTRKTEPRVGFAMASPPRTAA